MLQMALWPRHLTHEVLVLSRIVICIVDCRRDKRRIYAFHVWCCGRKSYGITKTAPWFFRQNAFQIEKNLLAIAQVSVHAKWASCGVLAQLERPLSGMPLTKEPIQPVCVGLYYHECNMLNKCRHLSRNLTLTLITLGSTYIRSYRTNIYTNINSFEIISSRYEAEFTGPSMSMSQLDSCSYVEQRII